MIRKKSNILAFLFFIISFHYSYSQSTIVIQPGPADGKDARVWTLSPNENFPDYLFTKANAWTWGGDFGIERTFIEFDLSAVTKNMIISEAKLSFYYHWLPGNPEQTNAGDNKILLQRTTAPWSENSITWNNQPTTTPLNYVEIPPCSFPQQDYTDIDVTALVSDALNYDGNFFSFLVRIKDEITYRRFAQASSDHPTPEKRPKLEIFYDCFIDLGSDTTICSSDTITLSAGPNFSEYLWNTGSTDSTIEISSTGIFWVQVIDDFGCIATDSIQIYSLPDPNTMLNLGADTTLCMNDTLILSPGSGFVNYLWQDGSTDSIFLVTTPGQYYVSVSNDCGEANDTIHISESNITTVNLGNDTTLCFGETLLLQPGTGYLEYVWQNGSTEMQFYVTEPGIYYVTVQDNCGTGSDTVNIGYSPEISLDLGNDSILCEFESIMLSPGSGFANYVWQDGSTAPFYVAQDAGTYWVEVTDGNNCNAQDEIFIDQLILSVDLGVDTALCPGAEIILSPDQSFDGYIWLDSLCFDPDFITDSAGIFWVTCFDSVDQKVCYKTDSITIDQLNVPLSPEFHEEYAFCPKEEIEINAGVGNDFNYLWNGFLHDSILLVQDSGLYIISISNVCDTIFDSVFIFYYPTPYVQIIAYTISQNEFFLSVNQGFESYFWSTGISDSTILVDIPGTYWIEVANEYDCKATDSIVIEPTNCDIFIPNLLTPNNDLSNDYFFIEGMNIQDANILIFNRWGEKVFQSEDKNFTWDGTKNGHDCSEGTYYYIISYYCNNFKQNLQQIKRKGTITLLR